MTLEVNKKLQELLALPAETEWVEFKAARGEFDFDQLGRYFSALSNEACLAGQAFGWLLLGVTNEHPRKVCGTRYKESHDALNKLKHEIAQETNHQLTFHAIHELLVENQRVLLFQIPASINGVPTEWRGRVYGRHGESVSPLSLSEIDRIRAPLREDWSAQVCSSATLAHLDPPAIEFARSQFKEKHPKLAKDIDGWDDMTFLNKTKVCLEGRVTHAALVLLGRPEASSLLIPAVAQITWVLKDEKGIEKDYAHFGPPFILGVNQVFSRVRNLTYRYLSSATLFPTEVKQYDEWVVRETLHNCIAHQDYRLGGRINVVEEPDSLLFTNLGGFIPGSVENMIHRDAPPEVYRNPFLAQAMVNLNMIDTIGSGIRRMFTIQRSRFFPLPDFDLAEPGRVKVRHLGKILDEKYTRMLIDHTDLDLDTIIALDKIQKKRPIDDETFARLKKWKLIEGRRPNVFISAHIAAVTGTKAAYIKHRGLDKTHYKALVVSFLEKFKQSVRGDIEGFLREKISDALSLDQKTNRIRNLLQEMRREGTLTCEGHGPAAIWRLAKPASNQEI